MVRRKIMSSAKISACCELYNAGDRQSGQDAGAELRTRATKHPGKHASRIRAQRRANPDLPPAPRHCKGHHRVDPGSRQQQHADHHRDHTDCDSPVGAFAALPVLHERRRARRMHATVSVS